MTAFFDHDGLTLYNGGALATLRDLPSESVDLCVTSPPFFALRDYQTGRWEGGDADCDHAPKTRPRSARPSGGLTGGTKTVDVATLGYAQECPKCGATRVDDQIGLERTPDEFVARLVAVFAEVRRMLKPSGVLLLEIGDTYSAGSRGSYVGDGDRPQTKQTKGGTPTSYPTRPVIAGLPGKNLLLMPARVALALQAQGWFVRGDYIWARENPMPSSARDRCTISHSYVFHLTKSRDYFWDGFAIAEEAARAGEVVALGGASFALRQAKGSGREPSGNALADVYEVPAMRNARSVWTIPTEPSSAGICSVCLHYWPRNAPQEHCGVEVVQHYAAFPSSLAEKAILGATSEWGCCCACGSPWRRLVAEGEPELAANTWSAEGAADQDEDPGPRSTLKHVRRRQTLGWEPSCRCGTTEVVPAVVLDPFAGSGTTLLASRKLGRHAVGVELNPLYAEITARRLGVPEAVKRAAETATEPTQLVIG